MLVRIKIPPKKMFWFAQVWSHVYGRDNLNVAPEDHAVLLTEAPLNPYKNRRQCAETFFENFGVPAMFCAPQVKDVAFRIGRKNHGGGLVVADLSSLTQAVSLRVG